MISLSRPADSSPAPGAPAHRPAYRPEIDGLRAVAVLAVMGYHAGWLVSGGFVGVDVFFVISGYLIGSHLLAELRHGRLDLAAFWEKRARRILPALAVVMLFTAIVGALRMLPADFAHLGASLSLQSLFVANHYFATHTGYFDQLAETAPLLHLWSLSVEEQFYAVFPLLLLLLCRLPRGVAAGIFALLCAGSLVGSIVAVHHARSMAFYFAGTRAWELGLGVLLAGSPRLAGPAWIRNVPALAGLGLIVAAAGVFDLGTPFPGAAALLPCLGAAAFLGANATGLTFAGRLLAWEPLVFVGRISYSLYLWHWPLLVFAGYGRADGASTGATLGAYAGATVAAVLSWKFIEIPFRRRAWLPDRRGFFRAAGAVAAGLTALGAVIWHFRGLPARLPAAALRYANAATDRDPAYEQELTLEQARAGRLPRLGATEPGAPLRFLVWGDSHAMSLLAAFDELGKRHHVRGCAATAAGTRPLVDLPPPVGAPDLAEAIVEFVRERHIRDVVLVSRWGTRHGRVYAWPHGFLAAIGSTLVRLHAAGARVWIVVDVPNLPWDVPRSLALVQWHGDGSLPAIPAEPFVREAGREIVVFSPALGSGDRILDPTPYFIRDGALLLQEAGAAFYYDDHHLSLHGARRLEPLFEPIFAP